MKKNLLIACVLLTSALYAQNNGQQPVLKKNSDKLKNYSEFLQQKATADFIPAYSEFYDFNLGVYELWHRNDFTYVMSNKLSTDAYSYFDGTNFMLSSRERYEYGSNFEAVFYESWDSGNSEWLPNWVDSTYFDANMGTTRRVGYGYDAILEEWEFFWGERIDHVYNGSNQLVSSTYYTMQSLTVADLDSRETWTWTTGNGPSEGLFEEYDDMTSTWMDAMRALNITWYNFAAFELTFATIQGWDGTDWINDMEISSTYHANGVIESMLMRSWDGTDFVNSYKNEQSIDANGLVIVSEDFYWDDAANAWLFDFGQEYTHSYGTNDELLQTDIATPDFLNGGYEESHRLVYGGHINIASVEELSIFALKLYPNPVGDVLNVLSDASAVYYQVFDVSGKVVLEGDFSLQTSLNTSRLKAGIYFLNASTSSGNHSVKFVKY